MNKFHSSTLTDHELQHVGSLRRSCAAHGFACELLSFIFKILKDAAAYGYASESCGVNAKRWKDVSTHGLAVEVFAFMVKLNLWSNCVASSSKVLGDLGVHGFASERHWFNTISLPDFKTS